MQLINDNILVTEVYKDAKMGELIVSQDSSSPYMFCKIDAISQQACEEVFGKAGSLNIKEVVLIIRRTAKEPFANGTFFISSKDVRGFMSDEEFENL